jgi:hypothetical protein
MTFNRQPPKPAKQTTVTPRPRPVARGSGLIAAALANNPPIHTQRAIASLLKTPDRKSQKIRDSANGEECTVRIPGCPGDPAMTIWSHAPLGVAGKGLQIKAICLCGAYACTYCDAVVDGQRPPPEGFDRNQALMAWFFGHMQSLVRLKQKGLA